MPTNEAIERMRNKATSEILVAEAMYNGMTAAGRSPPGDAADLIRNAREAFSNSNYYIAWDSAQKAQTVMRFAGGQAPAVAEKKADRLEQDYSGVVPAGGGGSAVEGIGGLSGQAVQSGSDSANSMDEAGKSWENADIMSRQQMPQKEDSGSLEHELPKPKFIPDYGTGRTYCPHCKSRITPVDKMFGGKKCPICSESV